ncbi:homoprotocatechuate degradation operon regulator HpaR [Paraherbaspirillum soli]|uniref:Homoprotocatechuate degradation operon regulator HpaR n=1 Tax=Paraherbaspirillum soli TaxID=631222 RepID=A0ABW0MGL6_9BURK
MNNASHDFIKLCSRLFNQPLIEQQFVGARCISALSVIKTVSTELSAVQVRRRKTLPESYTVDKNLDMDKIWSPPKAAASAPRSGRQYCNAYSYGRMASTISPLQQVFKGDHSTASRYQTIDRNSEMDNILKRRNLALLLLQTRECVVRNFRHILHHYELTEQQWRIIRTLSERETMEQRQIGETCQILSPSLVGVLARMEEIDLVERARVDADQRRVLVSLTAKSQALVQEIAPLIEAQYQNLESGVGSKTVRDLYQALDRFLAKQDIPIAAVELPGRSIERSAAGVKQRRPAAAAIRARTRHAPAKPHR